MVNGEEYPSEFISFLQSEAKGAEDTTLSEARAAALRAYNGELYGDEVEGQSKAVTRDVSEAVDWMLTGMLNTTLASGKAVEFETEPEIVQGPDGQQAKVDYGAEATAAIQYLFFRKQNGYRIIHDAAKAGMLERTGIAKSFAQLRAPSRQSGVLPRAGLVQDEAGLRLLSGEKVISADPLPEDQQPPLPPPQVTVDPVTGALLSVEPERHPGDVLHAVVHEVPQPPLVRDMAVPNEWFLVSPDAVELDEAPYVGECQPKAISDLVAMGYEYDMLKELWDNAPADTVVDYARDSQRSNSRRNLGRREGAQRQLWFYEEYPLYDLDGDGVSERLFVHRIGRTILKVMTVDEQPYCGWSPVPMQHRFTGQSIADKTNDIQRYRTILLRQALNSLYLNNLPRTTVNVDSLTEDTFDDLLTVKPGALIRHRGIAPAPFQTNDSSSVAFQAMEMMSAERESRTGVTRQSQGLNPDTINKTAAGMAMLQANSDQFELYVVRNFVEQLIAPLFAKRRRLMKAFTPPFRMKIDGQYRIVDPSKWPDDIDVVINVGLGTGTKDQRVAALTTLISTQAEAMAADSPLVTVQNQYEATSAWIEASGLGSPSRFVTDPSTQPPKPEQPKVDPEAVKAQAAGQLAQQESGQTHQQVMAKLQLQQEAQQASAQLDAQRNDQELQAKREAASLDIQLKRDKAAEEARLAQQQLEFEQSLAIRRQEFNEMQADRQRQQSEVDDILPKLRPGGALNQ